jgi:hypothetical protein
MELIKQPLARNDVPRSYAFVRKIRAGWPRAQREAKKLKRRRSIFQARVLRPASLSPQLSANGDSYRGVSANGDEASLKLSYFLWSTLPARACLIRKSGYRQLWRSATQRGRHDLTVARP